MISKTSESRIVELDRPTQRAAATTFVRSGERAAAAAQIAAGDRAGGVCGAAGKRAGVVDTASAHAVRCDPSKILLHSRQSGLNRVVRADTVAERERRLRKQWALLESKTAHATWIEARARRLLASPSAAEARPG